MNRLIYKNKNRYSEFLSIAKSISKKISRIEGVVGILATGGVARGYCDDYSDLDLIVYADDKVAKEIETYIAVGYLMYKEIGLDTPVELYQKALNHSSPSGYWSQVMRWDRANSQILFDTENRIRDLLKGKLVFPDWEQKKLLEKHRQAVQDHLKYNFEMWGKRGDLVNLANSLVRATEHVILWIYAKRKRFQPYLPKWLFYYLENDLLPESKYFNVIKKPYLNPIKTIGDAKKVRNGLLNLSQKVGLQFDYDKVEDLFAQCRSNWKKAPEKTKYYLSW